MTNHPSIIWQNEIHHSRFFVFYTEKTALEVTCFNFQEPQARVCGKKPAEEQLDIDLTKNTIYICAYWSNWLINILVFLQSLPPYPLFRPCRLNCPMVWSYIKLLVPCNRGAIPGHVKRSQDLLKRAEDHPGLLSALLFTLDPRVWGMPPCDESQLSGGYLVQKWV